MVLCLMTMQGAHMKRISILMGACAALAACGMSNSAGAKPAAICTAMLGGDAEVEADLAEKGKTVADYCACYATAFVQQSTDDRAAILKVTQVLADARKEQDLSLKAAGNLIDNAEGGTALGVSEAEFQTAGEYVETIREQLIVDDGLCAGAS
tara:strand:- start:1455 stop:1913 length:459 start_codon:yes stop_codon:yes gene_type:complete